MNKKELINAVGTKTNQTFKITEETINILFDEISNALAIKESITIVGFGKFSISDRASRDGINPSSGERIKIPSKIVPVFKASKTLKEKVN